MRTILINEIKLEKPNAQALGVFNASVSTGMSSSSVDESSSNRLKILENSLLKKEAELQNRFDNHFGTWKQTNGQPMNDKRNGAAFFNKIDKQNNAIRSLKESVQKTKDAIDYEKATINYVKNVKSSLPKSINSLIDKNEIKQWRKYPNTFFVEGVDKARIVYDPKKNKVSHKFTNTLPTGAMRSKFARIFNDLAKELNKK